VNEKDRSGLYRWLIDQPFVQMNIRDGRFKYHKLAQDLFSRHLFLSSRKDYYATRKAIANYYQQLLSEADGEAKQEIYNPAEVLELTLALAYQLFLVPNETFHIKAIKQFLNAYDQSEQTKDVTRVLYELYREQLMTSIKEGVRHSVSHLLEYMESDQTSPTFLAAVSYLVTKVGLESLFSINILANLYHERGYTFGVLEEYQRNVQKYSQTNVLNALPGLYRERADAYFAIEEYRRAIIDYNHALMLEPGYVLAYIHRGIAYRNLKEYHLAFTDFEHALKLECKNAIVYAERGRTHRVLKNYESAIADFTHSLDLCPDDVRAYIDRAMAYLLLGDLEQSKVDLIKSLELDPKDINVCWMILWIEMCQKEIDAGLVELLEEIASLDQQHYLAYVCKGVASWIQGHFEEAMLTLDQTITFVPETWDAYFWQGMNYVSLEMDEKAIKSFEHALRLGLPPLLFAPLKWLHQSRPDFYEKYVIPLLSLRLKIPLF
jgi:tetratricopeptide (TPR) repeat protein